MKKIISLLLAMMMVCSLVTVAFADDPFTSFVGEDVELFHIANLSCQTMDDDPNAIHTQYLAQHFVPAEEVLSGVKLRLLFGDGTAVMHFEIREGDANGEAIFTKDVEFTAQGNVKAWYTFDFGETVTVTPGQKYAVTFWLASKSTTSFCIAVGSYECNEGLDLWRHKRFETDYSGTRFEPADLPLKITNYTVGFEILTPAKMAAEEVDRMITALPAKITVKDEETVNGVVAAYEALSDEAKACVMNLDKLNASVDALAAAKEQYAKDLEEVAKVEELILNLPDPAFVIEADAEAVADVQGTYNALTKDQKALVAPQAVEKLNGVVAALKVFLDNKAVAEVEDMISALPTPTDITLGDMGDILAAEEAYNNLTQDQKALVNQELAEKLAQTLAEMNTWGEYTMGDVNKDGKVDAKDALIALKISVNKITPLYIETIVADADANGKVDAKDALEMLKFSVDKPSVLDQYYMPPIM